MDEQLIAELRANCRLLKNLSKRQVLGLLRDLQPTQRREGPPLIEDRSSADTLFVVLSGALRSSLHSKVLMRHGRYSVVGEMGLFTDDIKRTAAVEVDGEAWLLEIPYARIMDTLADNPRLGVLLLANLGALVVEKVAARDRGMA